MKLCLIQAQCNNIDGAGWVDDGLGVDKLRWFDE